MLGELLTARYPAGSSPVIAVLFVGVVSTHHWLLLIAPIVGCGCAWLGHFVFEKNKPAVRAAYQTRTIIIYK